MHVACPPTPRRATLVYFISIPIYIVPLEFGDKQRVSLAISHATRLHEKWICDCGRTEHKVCKKDGVFKADGEQERRARARRSRSS